MNTKLANLGPKSQAMLRHAGITTEAQLRALGSARAYALVKQSGAGASLNLLWAIEGALTNRAWQDVAKTERLSLLLQVEQLMPAGSMRSGSTARGRPPSTAPSSPPAAARRAPGP